MTNPFALTKTDREAVKGAVTPPPPPRACSKCGGSIGAGNKSGVCTPCQKPNRKRGGDKIDTAALLRESAPRPVAPKKATQVPAAWSEIPSVTQLRKVAFTLGLDGAQILTSFADAWLDRVLTAAHAAAEAPAAPSKATSIPHGSVLSPDPLEASLRASEASP